MTIQQHHENEAFDALIAALKAEGLRVETDCIKPGSGFFLVQVEAVLRKREGMPCMHSGTWELHQMPEANLLGAHKAGKTAAVAASIAAKVKGKTRNEEGEPSLPLTPPSTPTP